MANLSSSKSTNVNSKFLNSSFVEHPQHISSEVTVIITMIFNSLTCPFTVLLNVLVIMVVKKKRTSLQSNANILLARLAATDALTGLAAQPSFVLWRTFLLLGTDHLAVNDFHDTSIRILSVCSCLHLMVVVGERLVAIKYTFHYPYIFTKRNMKLAVSLC